MRIEKLSMADNNDFVLERQKNAISFALYFIKTIVFLSAGTIVALLALLGKKDFALDTQYGCLIRHVIPFMAVSAFLAVSSSYCGYWAELSAYNSGCEGDTKKKQILDRRQDKFFFVGHLLALFSFFIYFCSIFYLSWEFWS
jgi:hypothetical protein